MKPRRTTVYNPRHQSLHCDSGHISFVQVWQKKLATMFLERDIGLLTPASVLPFHAVSRRHSGPARSASGFMLGILEMGKFPAATLDPRTLGLDPPFSFVFSDAVLGF